MEWERNVWTGDDILKVDEGMRIVRMNFSDGALYRAENWGDYSRAFPIYGPWRKTLDVAKKDFPRLAAKARKMVEKI